MLFIGKEKEDEINEKKIVDSIRCLGLDMINEADSGHSGIVLGAAPILYTLYAKHLNVNPLDPNWYNRDRFILSSGHGSALLYSTLFLAGFDISLDDLRNFRKINSKTPGHPELNITPGVDMSTGPLGQGLASSVGIAISEEYLRNYYNKKGLSFINYYTYVLCGDGDLMEGVSYEAISLAGTLKLSHLIVIYDCNKVTLDSTTTDTFTENIEQRFSSMNWNTITVSDGEDINSIDNAIIKAKSQDKPTLIIVNTTIGKYSKYQNSNKAHGSILTKEEISEIKNNLGIRDVPFAVSQDAIEHMQKLIISRVEPLYNNWHKIVEILNEEDKKDYDNLKDNKLTITCDNIEYDLPEDGYETIRNQNNKILNFYATSTPFMIGGSADLSSSTKTYLENMDNFTSANRSGKNILFGVREHAMGCIANGIALTGLKVFTSTFLSFSDYMKPAIRMSALMKLPVIYIFTHDSISLGKDGPSHQPCEQLVSLRSIPNTTLFRPADVNELIGIYKYIMNNTEGPYILSIGRNKVKIKDNTRINEVTKGGYIVKKEEGSVSGIIISSGEELDMALEVSEILENKGFNMRVISMPSIELFNMQSDEYKNELLPVGTKVFVIESSSSYSWYKFVYNDKYLFTLDSFGSSGSTDDVYKKYGFDVTNIADKIEKLLK